jgi:uncharacterized membrane protein
MANVEDAVRSRVEAFVAELTTLVRHAALAAVQAQLGGVPRAPAAKAAPAEKGVPARPKASPAATPAPDGRPPSKPAAAAQARKAGQKRDPKDLAKLVERVAEYIKANPGQRVEQINRALGVPTKELTLPIKKLLHTKRITTKGEKRATVYAPK